MEERKAIIQRKTRETQVSLQINLDGRGSSRIKTPIGFLSHMLELWSRHSGIDLRLRAAGDIQVDIHHTNEDIGICLGLALQKALGEKKSVRRFGFSSVPMDEALVEVSLDLSARPYLRVSGLRPPPNGGVPIEAASPVSSQNYGLNDLKQFLQALVNNAGITLNVEVLAGEDLHHIVEAVFKALGRAFKEAVSIDPRIKGILSTKGRL